MNDRVRAAIERATAVLAAKEFYDRIARHRRFDGATATPAEIARLLRAATLTFTIRLKWHPYPAVLGWVDDGEPTTLYLNTRRLRRTEESIVGTIVHELVHAVDHTALSDFGHFGNRPDGNANTAPYWIGALAIELVAGGDPHRLTVAVLEAFAGGDAEVARVASTGDRPRTPRAALAPAFVSASEDGDGADELPLIDEDTPPTLQDALVSAVELTAADVLADLDELDCEAPEVLEDHADFEPEPPELGVAAVVPREPTRVPHTIDWRGTKLGDIERTRQEPYYGRFPVGMPSGLCLHYPVAHVWSQARAGTGTGPDRLRKGVDAKVRDSIAYARRTHTTKKGSKITYTYYVIDYLGRIHQDCDIHDRGVHGDTANRYTQGVEITSAGKLVKVGHDYYRTLDLQDGVPRSGRPPFPAWARRTVAVKQRNIKPGTYALFTPEQVRAIFFLHAGLLHCDAGRGIYRSLHTPDVSGVTSHDIHEPRKSDVGGSLFVDIEEFGQLLERFVAAIRTLGDNQLAAFADPDIVGRAYRQIVPTDPRYQQVYADWDPSALPIWQST